MKNIILKVLLTIMILIGLMMAGLNLLGGTSEAHRNGLESAFGAALQGRANFKNLKTFNIFPQVVVDIEGFETIGAKSMGDIHADNVKFSFDFFDLLFKNGRINQLDISNLKIDKGIYSDEKLDIGSVKIIPEKENVPAHLLIEGKYGETGLVITVKMKQMTTSIPPSYGFEKENDFTIDIGSTRIKGKFTPKSELNTSLQDLSIERDKKKCTNLREKNRFTMQSFTTYVFSEIFKSETGKTDMEAMCKIIMKYGI